VTLSPRRTHILRVLAVLSAVVALLSLFVGGPLVQGLFGSGGSDGVFYRCGSYAFRVGDLATRSSCAQLPDWTIAATVAAIAAATAVVLLVASHDLSPRRVATRLVAMTAVTTIALVAVSLLSGRGSTTYPCQYSPSVLCRTPDHLASATGLERTGVLLLAITAVLLLTSVEVRKRLREEYA